MKDDHSDRGSSGWPGNIFAWRRANASFPLVAEGYLRRNIAHNTARGPEHNLLRRKVHALPVNFHGPSLWSLTLVQTERASSSPGGIDEWHVIRAKIVTVESLGSYPACRDSRKKPELRAIRGIDLRAQSASEGGIRAMTNPKS